MLDVGAGAGIMAAKMLQHSPQSRVIAFEPFPGNMKFIKDRLGADDRVQILQKAVSSSSGSARFAKPATVSAGTPGWEELEGYSSIGYLVPENAATDTIDVDVTTIDEVASERVRFLKIDVQGGELEVLRGAALTIEKHGIDLMLVEYSGQIGVIEFLIERGYRLFDTQYLLVPRNGAEPDSADWSDLEDVALSTGAKSFYAWPNRIPRQKDQYAEFLSSYKKIGYVQTDLVAVHASVKRQFRTAAKAPGRSSARSYLS